MSRLLSLTAVAIVLLNLAGDAHRTVIPPRNDGTMIGLLQTTGGHASEEAAAGMKLSTLAVVWSRFEPRQGVIDEQYVRSVQDTIDAFHAAGQQVVLDPGLQDTPAWVFQLDDGTRFVDQYGDAWYGSNPGEDVANGVFDSAVRDAEGAYIASLRARFGDNFWAIRAGGLLLDELRYPPQTYLGRDNCYWAYDINAQSASPVPGWVPGRPSPSDAADFLDFYLTSLTNYEVWLTSTIRHSFNGWIEVLYPSWGIRPGQAEAAVNDLLSGGTGPEHNGVIANGLDWESEVAAIHDPRTVVYTTWIDAQDQGTGDQWISPLHYLEVLAAQFGLAVGGENNGHNTIDDLQYVVSETHDERLLTLMWFSERTLFNGSSPTFSDFAQAIRPLTR